MTVALLAILRPASDMMQKGIFTADDADDWMSQMGSTNHYKFLDPDLRNPIICGICGKNCISLFGGIPPENGTAMMG